MKIQMLSLVNEDIKLKPIIYLFKGSFHTFYIENNYLFYHIYLFFIQYHYFLKLFHHKSNLFSSKRSDFFHDIFRITIY